MNFRQEAHEPLTLVAPTGGVTAWRLAIVCGLVVLPQTSAAAGESFTCKVSGVCVPAKATGFAPAAGDRAYYDFENNQLAASGFDIGVYLVASASGDTTGKVLLTPEKSAAALAPQELQFNLRPANGAVATVVFDWVAPDACEFDSIKLRTNAKPASSAGTVVESITNLTGPASALAANVDLEADLTNDVTLSPALHGTEANKQFAKGDVIRFAIATDNADAVAGGGIQHIVGWHRI